MSRKERRRLELMSRVSEGQLTLVKAAELLGISYRQCKRVCRRYRQEGDAGLVHGSRGRASNRGRASVREAVLALYRVKYADFGPTLAREYLWREDGREVSVTTLRRWLLGAGLWERRRKRGKHRRWRERKEHLGEMVQMDGSHHDWFEGRGPWCVAMVMIDDATGMTDVMLCDSETTAHAMAVFKGWVERRGLPRSLYVDKDSIYRVNRDATAGENLDNTGALTQFGRAMKELEVELICANSPQAKGRVERMNGTLQDRLVKALRRKGIGDIAAANVFLRDEFLPDLNERFTVTAAKEADLHRAVGAAVKLQEVLSIQEQRVLAQDYCLAWRNRWFQVTAEGQGLVRPRQPVTVRLSLDGSVDLVYRGRTLPFKELTRRPARPARPPKDLAHRPSQPWKPPADHPWRGGHTKGGGSNSRSRCEPCSAPACSPTARKPTLRKAHTARST